MLYYSRDHAKTWEYAFLQGHSFGECSLAFLSNYSKIAMNCRTGKNRAQVTWEIGHGGTPISGPVTFPDGLIDPSCDGAIVSVNVSEPNGGVLFLSNDNVTKSRSHLTIKSSRDEGATWDNGFLLWSNFSAYSALVVMEEQTPLGSVLGLLFEYDHGMGFNGKIGFTTFVVGQVRQGVDEKDMLRDSEVLETLPDGMPKARADDSTEFFV